MCADHLHVMCSGLEVKATLVAMAEACLWVSQMEYLSCSLKIRRCPREEAGQGRFIQKPSVRADAEGWATMMSAGNLEWFRVRKHHHGATPLVSLSSCLGPIKRNHMFLCWSWSLQISTGHTVPFRFSRPGNRDLGTGPLLEKWSWDAQVKKCWKRDRQKSKWGVC